MECLFNDDHEDGYLCLKKNVWIDLNLNDSRMMYSNECHFDYCQTNLNGSNIIVDLKNSSLCDNDRKGTLCGKCTEE